MWRLRWRWTRFIPTRQRPLWFAVACGSAFTLLAGNDLWREHAALIAAEGKQTEAVARVLAEQTQDQLTSIALELQQVEERVDSPHDGSPAFVDDIMRVLQRRPAATAIRAFVVVDATGRVQAVHGEDAAARVGSTMANRDFFNHLSTDNAPRLSIGQPLQRADGQWRLPVARRLQTSDARFVGVLVAELNLSQEQRLYNAINHHDHGLVTLFLSSGWIVVASPANDDMMRRNWLFSPMFKQHLPKARNGTVRQVVVRDNIERIYSYRTLDQFSLVISVATSLTEVLAPWRVRALWESAALAVGLLLLFSATFAFMGHLRRRDEVETAFRESELRFRGLAENAPMGIFLADDKGHCTFTNTAWCQMTGLTPEQALGEGWVAGVHPEDRERVVRQWAGTIVDKKSDSHEYRLLDRNGRVTWVYGSAVALHEADGTLIHHIGSVVDITSRRQTEIDLQRALRDKEALFREVHHRVKNNLQVIASLLRLESGRTKHSESRNVLDEMTGRIRAMALLHESLYRTGNFASVDLADYLGQLAAQVFRAQSARQGNIALSVDMVPAQIDLEKAIPCGLLLNELVSNSLKHGFPDGRSGEVRIVLTLDDDQSRLKLRVSDNGVGLPADFASRCEQSLGMQLASDLAGQIGGKLVTIAGSGSSFEVDFSIARKPATPAPIAPEGDV